MLIEKKQIMFVDDEQNVLDGFRRTFYNMREKWDMFFALSGEEALAIMEERPIDVVVTDMRMPEMDGAELLERVKATHPHVIRFILSGYATQEMSLRTIRSADQFLMKPCSQSTLEKALLDALDSHKLVQKRQLQAMVSEMESLPTLPALYVKMMHLLASPKSSFDDIAQIVSKDITMTAKILHLINSAFFGLKYRISDVKQAIVYLGMETLKAVILTTDIFSQFSAEELKDFDVKELYRHSYVVSTLARQVLEVTTGNRKYADEASTASILHDVGKVIFLRNRPEEYREVLTRQQRTRRPMYELEREILGCSHAEIGGYLMSVWGLPSGVVEAISNHHNPLKQPEPQFNSLAAVYVANILYHNEMTTEFYNERLEYSQPYLDALNVTEHMAAWDKIAKKTHELCKEADELF